MATTTSFASSTYIAQSRISRGFRGALAAATPVSFHAPSRPRGVPRSVCTPRAGANDGTKVVIGGLVDFYELLQVPPDSTKAEIKAAYYDLCKECHPDIASEGHDMCVLLNLAYDTLGDVDERASYDMMLAKAMLDDADGYTGQPVSKWMGLVDESRGVFVDECSCIGCRNCVYEAPATFRMEEEFGRSRVFAQWLNTEEQMQTAIDSCPVDCIHWVDRQQLPILEHVMIDMERVSVGTMGAGQGNVDDVFSVAANFSKRRAEKLKEQAKERKESATQQEARQKAAADIQRRQEGKWGKLWKNQPGFGSRNRRNSTVPLERSMVPSATSDNTKKYNPKP